MKHRSVLIGLGNSFRGDDAIGLQCINLLEHLKGKGRNKKEKLIALSLEQVNLIREDRDNLDEVLLTILEEETHNISKVLFIDAAEMNLEPGMYRILDAQNASFGSISTHTFPFEIYTRLLQKQDIVSKLLLIQPSTIGHHDDLSEPMQVFLESKFPDLIREILFS